MNRQNLVNYHGKRACSFKMLQRKTSLEVSYRLERAASTLETFANLKKRNTSRWVGGQGSAGMPECSGDQQRETNSFTMKANN